jgi:hypothetical protein
MAAALGGLMRLEIRVECAYFQYDVLLSNFAHKNTIWLIPSLCPYFWGARMKT